MIEQIDEIHKTATLESFDGSIRYIMARVRPAPKSGSRDNRSENSDSQKPENDKYKKASERDELQRVVKSMEELRDNPIDRSKPYATPWKPRPWMAPFVFIPRYLEVNQNICAAVYLRHPVARPGLAEVPSPFTIETNQLAFTWYLRRR